MSKILRLSVYFLILYIQPTARGIPLTGDSVRYAQKDEFPFVVSLSRNLNFRYIGPENNHFCTGSLITAKHVLTAAHCLRMYKPRQRDEFVVKINKRDLALSTVYQVKKWTTYNQWVGNEVTNSTIDDVAIVELTKKVSLNIKPAVLTTAAEAQLYNMTAVVAGWGLIENGKRTRILTIAEVKVLEAKECLRNLKRDVVSEIDNPSHRFLCSSAEPPVYTECGDSGGPLLVNSSEIIGVTKGNCYRKSAEGTSQRQNVHMSVEYYKKFITRVTKCKDKRCCIQ